MKYGSFPSYWGEYGGEKSNYFTGSTNTAEPPRKTVEA